MNGFAKAYRSVQQCLAQMRREVGSGFSYFFTSGLGLTSELSFDLFYGAATLDSQYSAVPVLSLSLGVVVDYEVLP